MAYKNKYLTKSIWKYQCIKPVQCGGLQWILVIWRSAAFLYTLFPSLFRLVLYLTESLLLIALGCHLQLPAHQFTPIVVHVHGTWIHHWWLLPGCLNSSSVGKWGGFEKDITTTRLDSKITKNGILYSNDRLQCLLFFT